MSEPKDMILPLLRDLREQIGAIDAKLDRHQAENAVRFNKIDASHKGLRQAMTTDTLMSKFLLGDFEERLAQLEQRLDSLAVPKA